MSTAPTTATRLAALEARVAELEAIDARLIHAMSRFTAIFDNHFLAITELMVDEFTARDQETAATTAELEAAIRSRAPRGFKFPITVHQTVVSPVTIVKNTWRKPLDEHTWRLWGEHLRYISGLAETHQLILKRNGMVDEQPAPVRRTEYGLQSR